MKKYEPEALVKISRYQNYFPTLVPELQRNVYDQLTDNPYLYQLCDNPALEKRDYRKVVIGNYVMIYRVDEERNSVYILHFFYGRQD